MTPQREQKFLDVIFRRQPDLTVIMENIHDPHNISAMLRSCDAVGIMEVNVINTRDAVKKKLGKKSSASARKWIRVNYFDSVVACVSYLKNEGFTIYGTHLSSHASDLYELDLNQKVALAFGNEHSGVSDELLEYVDGNFIIPMNGMIPSLNVSVACAVTLYEAFRQRQVKGRYDKPSLTEAEIASLYTAWKENN